MVEKRANSSSCRFSKAAPRHFLFPALLLLLAEEPRHGYRLMDALLRLGFGPFDRPSVYRALSQLESDGYLRSWSAAPTAGSTRQVYAVTEAGFVALAEWMEVIDDERAQLEKILKRHDLVVEGRTDHDDLSDA